MSGTEPPSNETDAQGYVKRFRPWTGDCLSRNAINSPVIINYGDPTCADVGLTRKIKLASFDMDGTVLEHNSSWVAIHRHFGTEHQGAASLRLYTEGKIDYREFMRRDIASWPPRVTRREIEGFLAV